MAFLVNTSPWRKLLRLVLASFFATTAMAATAKKQEPNALTATEAKELATEAYLFFYPLMSLEISRQQMTNVEAGKMPGFGPANQFHHMRAFPEANFKAVVRPNFDTLYSSAWLDVSKEPLIVTMPATDGRYYLLPVLDMWSDVIGAPGKRTSGTEAQKTAFVLQGWKGTLPKGVQRLEMTTPYSWMIGRIQTNGPADYTNVNKIQDQMSITPLSQWGQKYQAPKFKFNPSVDMKTPPLEQVNGMSAEKYFALASALLKKNPMHITDWSQNERLKKLGLDSKGSFNANQFSSEVRQALEEGAKAGLVLMKEKVPTLARVANGWSMNTDTMGVYGNYYLKRAIVAMVGLGANQPDDAIYPMLLVDSKGRTTTGDKNYVLHFNADQMPPNTAFWSITAYDSDGFQVANELNRFAIGDRDQLKFNKDGSLDLYFQHKRPSEDKVSNWLPTPASGPVSLTMRIYAPKAEALDGRWAPPAVVRQYRRSGQAKKNDYRGSPFF
jgi:hypothetical protein